MTDDFCCGRNSASANQTSNIRRLAGSTKWIVPTTIFALVPKCPMCVAAYIALATGFGVSLAAASWIRIGLTAMCLGTLAFLLIRVAIRAVARRRLAVKLISPSRIHGKSRLISLFQIGPHSQDHSGR
jgi:hypothetical protein